MSEKELTEAALAENIFRINHWNWLKSKKSKIIVTVLDFQKKNKNVQCKDFWIFLVEASQKFAFSKSFGREILRIGLINWLKPAVSVFLNCLPDFYLVIDKVESRWRVLQAIPVRCLIWCLSQSDWQSSISSRE